MRIKIVGKSIIGIPESEDDIKLLLGTQSSRTMVQRKQQRKKTCQNCGRIFKGRRGLGVHMSKCKATDVQSSL